jgi:ATP-dependent DNA helicase RecG
MDLQMNIRYLKGVGPSREKLLADIGIKSVYDLLTYFPRDYADRSYLKLIAQLQDHETTTIQATVIAHHVIYTRRRKKLLKIDLSDGTGLVTLVCFNQPYLQDTLSKGLTIIVSGKFEKNPARANAFTVTNFTYEVLSGDHEDLIHTGRIVPVYSVTQNLNMRFLRSLIRKCLAEYADQLTEFLPASIRQAEQLIDWREAVEYIHFPPDFAARDKARQRLVFNEFFILETALAMRYFRERSQNKGISYELKKNLLTPFKKLLPFELTSDQKKVLKEIFADMRSDRPMNRLLQGDVGSGKTIIALAAILLAAENGYQSVLMAPTEILAEQHYIYLEAYLPRLGVKHKLLTSGTEKKEAKETKAGIGDGTAQVIIGTHALLEGDIDFKKLGLVIIDEQHKFGVRQRALLRRKGRNPDVLVMTATPIPRSLALTLYGDLDVSTIRELPPGRLPVKTSKMKEQEAYAFIREQVRLRRQAYIVYPLIEESPHFTMKAAKKMAAEMQQEVFPEFKVGLLHGRLKMPEKEQVMADFKDGKTDILVSTTVIEVGIDVANASAMLIEHAERFGLATLHQLRGRVGRGREQSYCLLLAEEKTPESRSRMRAMLETTDGFRIAEEDLKIRGPGEFFGVRQSGLPEFKLADVLNDFAVLARARQVSFDLIKEDPYLRQADHGRLLQFITSHYTQKLPLIEVG